MRKLWMLPLLLITMSIACNMPTQAGSSPTDEPPVTDAPTEPPSTTEGSAVTYYAFSQLPVEGSVMMIPDQAYLYEVPASTNRTDDTAANLRTALQAMIVHPSNTWSSTNLSIDSVTVDDAGQAHIVMTGDIMGVGGAILAATRWQFLLTVFADPAVQSAVITLNDFSIGNLGISISSEAKDPDYAYTRAEVDAVRTENQYTAP